MRSKALDNAIFRFKTYDIPPSFPLLSILRPVLVTGTYILWHLDFCPMRYYLSSRIWKYLRAINLTTYLDAQRINYIKFYKIDDRANRLC